MGLFGLEPIKVSYDPVQFGGDGHSDSRDIIVLVCQVISQDDVIKAVRSLMVNHHAAKFGAREYCLSGDMNADKLKQIPTAQKIHSWRYENTTNAGSRIRWISVTIYAPLLAQLLFSLKHLACHALTHKNFGITEHLSHNFTPVISTIRYNSL